MQTLVFHLIEPSVKNLPQKSRSLIWSSLIWMHQSATGPFFTDKMRAWWVRCKNVAPQRGATSRASLDKKTGNVPSTSTWEEQLFPHADATLTLRRNRSFMYRMCQSPQGFEEKIHENSIAKLSNFRLTAAHRTERVNASKIFKVHAHKRIRILQVKDKTLSLWPSSFGCFLFEPSLLYIQGKLQSQVHPRWAVGSQMLSFGLKHTESKNQNWLTYADFPFRLMILWFSIILCYHSSCSFQLAFVLASLERKHYTHSLSLSYDRLKMPKNLVKLNWTTRCAGMPRVRNSWNTHAVRYHFPRRTDSIVWRRGVCMSTGRRRCRSRRWWNASWRRRSNVLGLWEGSH